MSKNKGQIREMGERKTSQDNVKTQKTRQEFVKSIRDEKERDRERGFDKNGPKRLALTGVQ